MNLKLVNSSNLRAVGYDEAEARMRIYFHKKEGEVSTITAIWDYEDISPDKVERLIKAPSVGTYWNQHLRVICTPKGRKLLGEDYNSALALLHAFFRSGTDSC